MIIQPTSLAALTWAGAAAGSTADSWRIGTVLSARPLGVSPQGMMILQIGALAVETQSPSTQLPPQFQVRVLSMGAEPLLEVMIPSGPETFVQQAMRERLPQQNGYAPLLATLDTLAQRPQVRQLPSSIRTALALLENAMRTPEEISDGPGLREAVARSGLFLEAQLADPMAMGEALGEEDWKGALLRLATALQTGGYVGKPSTNGPGNAPDTAPPLQHRGLLAQPRAAAPEEGDPLLGDDAQDLRPLLDRLNTDVHAALARLEVAQLETAATSVWMVEIPVQGKDGRDVVQLQLEQGATSSDPSTWTLGFALELPSLGPVQGEVQLRGQRLSVRLWAHMASTVEKLDRRFDMLRDRLAASGLILDQLSCQHGMPQTGQSRSAVLLKTMA
ncbi:flagellar hook-length control protein FliK [Dyella sp. GSA-30]|uniref:flagellar hook-length control protein FliK n=1 Tax=Dyella sp. GSA-30 TaxID=2994496 RepID=UPI002490F33F|nr:flagellar hook-length control protein FliK [Dyella sp. GSA-30]